MFRLRHPAGVKRAIPAIRARTHCQEPFRWPSSSIRRLSRPSRRSGWSSPGGSPSPGSRRSPRTLAFRGGCDRGCLESAPRAGRRRRGRRTGDPACAAPPGGGPHRAHAPDPGAGVRVPAHGGRRAVLARTGAASPARHGSPTTWALASSAAPSSASRTDHGLHPRRVWILRSSPVPAPTPPAHRTFSATSPVRDPGHSHRRRMRESP